MNGDFDRMTFDARASFASVLAQQGRVLLPADLNEQTAIHHHYLRSLVADLQGARWRPGGGFNVISTSDVLQLSAGHFYVDGILCDNPGVCDLTAQPFAPIPDSIDNLKAQVVPLCFYLDCWERHVTWFQYPRLREVALGGPDTASRLQIAWQVRPLITDAAKPRLEAVLVAIDLRIAAGPPPAELAAIQAQRDNVADLIANIGSGLTAAAAQNVLDAFDAAPPRLAAATHTKTSMLEPCALEASAQYRGRENQLYRIEVHREGLAEPGVATLKWSRENGSVAFRVLDVDIDADEDLTRVIVESLGRDRRTGLCVNDWVELSDRGSEMRQESLPLLKVVAIDVQRCMVTLAGKVSSTVDAGDQAILRRWDHKGNADAEGCVFIKESGPTEWLEIERGLRIRFDVGGYYPRGAYWLIAARAGSIDIDWPSKNGVPAAIEPQGVRHHRAAITVATRAANKWTLTQPKGLK